MVPFFRAAECDRPTPRRASAVERDAATPKCNNRNKQTSGCALLESLKSRSRPVKEELTPQQVQATYQQIEKECSVMINKIAELEQELNEHALVIKAFDKVDSTRRCFRMVGGVLVERTVAEVRPAVESNLEKIQQAVNQLQEQLKKKTEQRTQFIQKYNLNQQKQASPTPAPEADAPSKGGGSVLV
ncbi:Prefoldin subunit 2 [Symbiodinium microadriaticum]|uniref:Prefoldin subunit 2 n=1 Tax=Symbiodinium microadriaticum TaxID=2951 RepID=A0A1Q9E873_SYMMI|nr:Prefoldin subunit 2 [Symbiodinium microadriaticum]CAE7829966.1 PFDN2 [Symbiodinium microadriaticum]CAE7861338.1 PFDN2 [Symbiodinium sp. KB8]